MPCDEAEENDAWIECVLAAADLVCWSKLPCFIDDTDLARCEIGVVRYKILHMAARITFRAGDAPAARSFVVLGQGPRPRLRTVAHSVRLRRPPPCRRPLPAASGNYRQILDLTRLGSKKGSYYTASRSSRDTWYARAKLSGPDMKQGG